MGNFDFKFFGFQENVIERAIFDTPAEGTLFVFPTESSRSLAIRMFQDAWQFSFTQFLTIEEVKELAFCTDRPLLKEEKRTLALYSALTGEDKEHFKIQNYFQSIEFARHFFELWEEFNEELVAPELPLEKFAGDDNFLDWQRETYQRLLTIRGRYHDEIESKHFSDIIFIYHPDHFDAEFFREFRRVVFVNQFYYTELEKFILKQLSAAGKQVTLIYQIPEELVDKENLSIGNLELSKIREFRTKKVHLFEAPNQFSMLTKFFEIAEREQINHVVDVKFQENGYPQFLSREKFHLTSKMSFTNTSVFRLLQKITDLMDSLILDKTLQTCLIPIDHISDCLISDEVFMFVAKQMSGEVLAHERQGILEDLNELIAYDFRYIDLAGRFFSIQTVKNAKKFVNGLTDLIKRLLKIKNIEELINWINHPEQGIVLEHICSEFELEHTDIRSAFYQALGDFSAIEEIWGKAREKWHDYFGLAEKQGDVSISSGLLRLLVEYLKAKKVTVFRESNQAKAEKLISVSNLEDTRNISYNKIAVWNASEETIPSPRKAVFLFTENQRRKLGLKTYEEIRERERYYFFRTLFNSSEVYLFSIKNIDQNIAVSSFVEEINLFRPDLCASSIEIPDKFYREVYGNLLPVSTEGFIRSALSADFFTIPVKKEIDFPDDCIELTPYAFVELIENKFSYFLKYHAGVEKLYEKVEEDMSNTFIGNFAHEVLNRIWRTLIDRFGIEGKFDFSVVTDDLIKQQIHAARRMPTYFYKIPQTYGLVYFDEVFSRILVNQIMIFFDEMAKRFGDRKIEVFPERDYGTAEEKEPKTWIAKADEENDAGIEVKIKGRRDLLVTANGENKEYFIYDYKTGTTQNYQQLIIYALFYFLINDTTLSDFVHCYFYEIMKGNFKSERDIRKTKSREDMISEMKADILAALKTILENGYSLPDSKKGLGAMGEITREDLYRRLRASNLDE